MDALRILTVITPSRLSGAERIAISLARGLVARGHTVAFACRNERPTLGALEAAGLPCLTTGIRGKLNPAALWRLLNAIRSFEPDVIHTHLSTAGLLGSLCGRLRGIPVVSHVHALNTWAFYRLADLIVTCSGGVRQHLLNQGAPADRVRLVYNGVDGERLQALRSRDEVRAEWGATPHQPVIGVIAHLSEKKGHRYLIEAVALLRERHPDLLCFLIGDGPLQEHLQTLAADLGVAEQVRFTGFRPDALDLTGALDIVVLPSVAKEGLGMTLLEAAALGRPVVASDAPGIDEAVVRDETGLLVPPADAGALARAIERLITDPDLRSRMGEAGRERVQRMFTMERMVAEMEEVFAQALRSRGRR